MPYEANCDNCNAPIFVYKSKKTGKEYARDSATYINYDAGEKPDYHRCPNWRGAKEKVQPKPQPQKETTSSEANLQPTNQMVTVDDKITSITISRTASYKYGRAKQYAEEKEEFMDSITVGLSVDVSSEDPQAIERKMDNSKQIITNELKREIWDRYQFKLIGK